MEQKLSFPSPETIEQAQDGDQEAFGEIFDHFIPTIYRFALFRSGSVTQGQKLTAEIFSKLWKNLRKFHFGGRVSFRVFLFALVLETTAQFLTDLAKLSPERRTFLRGQELQSAELGTEEKELLQAFSELPAAQAEAVIFRYFCQLSNEEIAIILEKTEGAIRILQSRGIKRLREIIDQLEKTISPEIS